MGIELNICIFPRVSTFDEIQEYNLKNPIRLDEKIQFIVLISNAIYYKMCFHVKLECLFSDPS